MAHGDYGMPTMPPMKFKKVKGGGAAEGEPPGTLAKPTKKTARGSRRAAGQKGRRKG